ncbi:hypothetical protein QO206_00510 [Leeuwenhoekiella aequorea]|uniref:hypothetical protein n=1 Tax=Leeuwenhoekiella aequorea TaxID=283736 RepID=UPI00352CB5A6
MIDKNSIVLLTTVSNFDLYNKTKYSHPKGIKKVVIDGQDGMYGIESLYYSFKKLRNRNIKWLILADEDVIFLDNLAIFDIIEKLQDTGAIAAGVRDGGTIPNRIHNPYVPNMFFCVLNFEKIVQVYNKKEIKKNEFISKDEFIEDLSGLKEPFKTESLFEPYYKFFLWLKRKGEHYLFLNAELYDSKNDELTTLVKSLNGKPMLIHTWFARSYGWNKYQTKRIDSLLQIFNSKIVPEESESVSIIKDPYFKYQNKIKKFFLKLKMKSFIK